MTSVSDRSQDVEVLTFGCRLNLVESEAMRRAALACRRTNLVIINTCAVTAEAARQARQAIRRVRRERPGAEIVVTGCAAQIDPADDLGSGCFPFEGRGDRLGHSHAGSRVFGGTAEPTLDFTDSDAVRRSATPWVRDP